MTFYYVHFKYKNLVFMLNQIVLHLSLQRIILGAIISFQQYVFYSAKLSCRE
jgi:hypothetical protein